MSHIAWLHTDAQMHAFKVTTITGYGFVRSKMKYYNDFQGPTQLLISFVPKDELLFFSLSTSISFTYIRT